MQNNRNYYQCDAYFGFYIYEFSFNVISIQMRLSTRTYRKYKVSARTHIEDNVRADASFSYRIFVSL